MFVRSGLALARIGTQVFAFGEDSGIVGPLTLVDDVTWVGLDGRGRVLMAGVAGQLLRAPSVEQARDLAGFVPWGEVAGATAWDAQGDFVAAATPTAVFLSSDGGESFRPLGQVDVPPLSRVFVRSDGVVAAQADTPDGQKTWLGGPARRLLLSGLQPGRLTRIGDRILAASPDHVVLSRDGLHWVGDEGDPDAEFEANSWIRVFELSDRPVGYARSFSPSLWARPPEPHRKPQSNGTPTHRTRAPRIQVVRPDATPGSHCACAAYIGGLVDAPLPLSRHTLALFSDGRCDAAHEDPTGRRAGQCALDAPLTRSPSLAIVDRINGTVAAHQLPQGCRPEAIASTGGVGVLLCSPLPNTGRLSLYLVDAAGRYYRESELELVTPVEATTLSHAPDGTLLLRVRWGIASDPDDPPTAGRRAFVRSPFPLGHPGAWRELALRDALEVRVDLGGGVVIVTVNQKVPCPGSFGLAFDRPGEPRRPLGGPWAVAGTLYDLFVRQRRIEVVTGSELASNGCRLRREAPDPRPHFVVMEDGTLSPDHPGTGATGQ